MAQLNLSELNNFVQNLLSTVKVKDLTEIHAERVKQWLIENLSKVGRYGVKDYERFGTLESFGKAKNDGRPVHVDRVDGWVSLTEEVPDLDHLTYGTGMLYVHGEVELPQWWEDLGDGRKAGDHTYEDEFHQVNYSGTQKFLFERTTGETYSFWYEPETTRTPPNGATKWGENDTEEWKYGYQWSENPEVPAQINVGTMKPKKGITAQYSDKIAWYYDTITWGIAGIHVEEKQDVVPDGENDADIYHLDNERNNYPFRIIQSATPKSVRYMLDEIIVEGGNGMYDETLPEMATEIGTYPPTKGFKYVKQGKDGLVNFISPIEDVPATGSKG